MRTIPARTPAFHIRLLNNAGLPSSNARLSANQCQVNVSKNINKRFLLVVNVFGNIFIKTEKLPKNRDQKQTVTLNLAINVDVTQLVGLLKSYTPRQSFTPVLPEPAITLQEAADLLNCSKQKVRDLVREGRIPNTCAFRVGSLYRFHRSELIDWFQNSPRTA